MYRLVVDFPLGEDQEKAIEEAKTLANVLFETAKSVAAATGVKVMQYRLQEDTDRTPRNYLDIDESGHVSTKKIVVQL